MAAGINLFHDDFLFYRNLLVLNHNSLDWDFYDSLLNHDFLDLNDHFLRHQLLDRHLCKVENEKRTQ